MTLDELKDAAWAALPPIRKRVAGRNVVDDLVSLCVMNWEPEYLAACQDNDQRNVYERALLQAVKRGYQPISGHEPQEYGFIWVFLLAALASAVIQWLVKRWLDNHFPNEQMAQWKRELTGR